MRNFITLVGIITLVGCFVTPYYICRSEKPSIDIRLPYKPKTFHKNKYSPNYRLSKSRKNLKHLKLISNRCLHLPEHNEILKTSLKNGKEWLPPLESNPVIFQFKSSALPLSYTVPCLEAQKNLRSFVKHLTREF